MANQPQPLTQDQIEAIAKNYQDMAASIGDYLIANAKTISDADETALEQKQNLLLQYADQYIADGIALQQAELDASAQDIQNAVSSAQQAIKNIADADKALQIATAVAVLGASVLKADYTSIPGEIQGVWSAIRIKTGSDSDDSDSDS